MSNEAVRAIQALRILRTHSELRGQEYVERIRTTVSPGTLPQRLNQELEPVFLLLDAGLIKVYIKAERRPGKDIPFMSAERFKQTWAQFGLDSYIFTVSETLSVVQRALGLFSLVELEQRAAGDTITAAPLFGLPRHTHLKRNIFTLMPPSALMRPIYDLGIRPAADGLNLSISRAEDFFAGRVSVIELWEAIYAADIILGDCTGRHPGVFYQLGIAHTLGKHTIVISQNLDDIPIEFRQLHHFTYENSKDGLTHLCSELQQVLLTLARQEDVTGQPG